jgi:hypothetical protein
MRSTDAALTSVRIHQALTTWFGKLGARLLHTLHQGENRKQKAESRKQKAGSRQQTAESKQQTAGSRQQKVNSRQQIAEKRAIRKKETDR